MLTFPRQLIEKILGHSLYVVKTRPNEFGSMTARKGDIKPL